MAGAFITLTGGSSFGGPLLLGLPVMMAVTALGWVPGP